MNVKQGLEQALVFLRIKNGWVLEKITKNDMIINTKQHFNLFYIKESLRL